LKSYDKHLAGAAITFEGRGFKMTMVRSVITAINMASRTQFPNSVFADVDSAATWLAMCAPTLRSANVLSVVDQLRR
jgi:tRNA U38,U39,U40 pseudouridine synthase TruA